MSKILAIYAFSMTEIEQKIDALIFQLNPDQTLISHRLVNPCAGNVTYMNYKGLIIRHWINSKDHRFECAVEIREKVI